MAILKSSLSQNQGQASPKREDRRFEGRDLWIKKFSRVLGLPKWPKISLKDTCRGFGKSNRCQNGLFFYRIGATT